MEKNPSPLIAQFMANPAVELQYQTRAKMGESCDVYAVAVLENGKTFFARKEVKVTLAGRIRSMRPKGKLCFAHIEDGDGKIQLFLRVNEVGEDRLAFFNKMFDLGDFVEAVRAVRV